MGGTGYSISICFENLEKLNTQLDALDIEIYAEPYIEGNVLSFSPTASSKELTYYISRLPGTDESRWNPKQVFIADFPNSESFYNLFRGEKKTFKILTDDYSYKRAQVLYEYVADLEKTMRNWYARSYGGDQINPKNKMHKLPDHLIAQLDILEFFQHVLFSPSSDDYFLENIKKASTSAALLSIRKATKSDEMKLPFSEEEYRKFAHIRNAVMHFKVITINDASFCLDFVSKFQAAHLSSIFMEVLKRRAEVA